MPSAKPCSISTWTRMGSVALELRASAVMLRRLLHGHLLNGGTDNGVGDIAVEGACATTVIRRTESSIGAVVRSTDAHAVDSRPLRRLDVDVRNCATSRRCRADG